MKRIKQIKNYNKQISHSSHLGDIMKMQPKKK